MFLENTEIATELRKGALRLQSVLEWDDLSSEQITSHEDDEYRWAGVEDPKIVITTSREPSSRLKMFAKVYTISNYYMISICHSLKPKLCFSLKGIKTHFSKLSTFKSRKL